MPFKEKKMKCPICDRDDDKVLETRMAIDGGSIRRRRECNACGYRFTTYETIEQKKLMVIKRDERREEFNFDKLASGINKAIEKRPISRSVIDKMLLDIEEEASVIAAESHEISSHDIGEMVMEHLHKLDEVAYIRFASVYRQFKDVNEFIKEIKSIKKK